MKNKLVRSMLMVGIMVMALVTPVYAMEEEKVVYSAETAQTRSASSPTIVSIKDAQGNGYNIITYSDKSGTTAIAETGFSVYHYAGGTQAAKETVDGYRKELSLSSTIKMSNNGEVATTEMSNSSKPTGANGACYKSKKGLYSVTYVKTTHTFKCNGKSWDGTTYL